MIKREVIKIKIGKSRRRAQFLFNDGEFRPRTEKCGKAYKRKPKNRRELEENFA